MRQYIYDQIEFERLAQLALWSEEHDNHHLTDNWGGLLVRHLGLAMTESDSLTTDWARFRKQMVRVAALAVAAIEATDRRMGIAGGNTTTGKGY